MKGFTEAWLRANYADADLVLGAKGARTSVELKCGPPVGVVASRWEFVIPNWMPASKNLKTGGPWKWYRARQKDDSVVATACLIAGVTEAWCKRRVSLAVEKKNARHLPDPQNLEESFFDALERGRYLVKDSAEWMESPRAALTVNRDMDVDVRSTITIEDLP